MFFFPSVLRSSKYLLQGQVLRNNEISMAKLIQDDLKKEETELQMDMKQLTDQISTFESLRLHLSFPII